MSAQDRLKAGDVDGWVAALAAPVKKAPTDSAARLAFGQGLIVAGDLERADNQFDLVISQDPTWAPRTALLRQLVRALKSRVEFFEHGRPPELLKPPSDYLQSLLIANVALREEGGAQAGAAFQSAEALRPPIAGALNDAPFEDCRDLDDRTSGVLEVLTSTGKYYWIELSHIRSIAIREPGNFLDTILLPADVEVADGPAGVVYLPAIYWTAPDQISPEMMLGRMSDWQDDGGGVTKGLGRRCFLIGDNAEPLEGGATLDFGPAR